MKTRLITWPLVGALSLVATASCGGGSSGPPMNPIYGTMGMLGDPSLAVVVSNLIYVDGSINGSGGNSVLIDSGSPVVLLDGDPGTFPGLTLPAMQQVTVDFGFLDASGAAVVTIDQIPALQLTTAMGTIGSLAGLPGILGGDIMRDFSVQLDYAAPMMEGFCLGCSSGPRGDVESPGGAVPFTLAGGGVGTIALNSGNSSTVTIPATRIPLTVQIEGTNHPFILDTGASEVTVTSAVYQALVADGRAQLAGGLAISTVTNDMENASVTRAKTISLGGETVNDVPVMTIPVDNTQDDLLGNISSELGYPLDGLLGGSFLKNFLLTIDYPNGTLHLQRYNSPPIADEFRRVGFTVTVDAVGKSFVVSHVYPGTDAQMKGVAVDDQVVAIGGQQLSLPADALTADNLLDGMPGSTIQVQFGRTMAAALMNQTVALQVDDLIPNPQ
jgi:hypothetical protein